MCTVPSPRPASPASACPLTTWGWGVWVWRPTPSPRTILREAWLGRTCGLSLPSPLGAGPLRQQAARACPGVTPRGGRGQEQGAHSAAASGQPTGQPEVGGGEQAAKAGRPGVGRAERGTRRETETQRQRDRKEDGWSRLCLSLPEVWGSHAPARLQPPKLLLDPAEPGVAHQHRSPLGPKWGSCNILGRPLTHPKWPLPGQPLWAP